MRLHPYEFENCWSEFCLYTLPHCDVPVCLFASLTLSSMSASALRVGFCIYGAHTCSFALARFSKQYTFNYLWRSVPCTFKAPSCAVIFPSMACRHALPQTLSVFVCFRTCRSNSVLMMVVLDMALSDDDSVCALSYMNKQSGENVLCAYR